MGRWLLAALLLGLAHALVFFLLAIGVGVRVPLVVSFGKASRWGAESLDEAFGGVRRLEIAIGWRTLNSALAMDAEAKDAWMRATAARPPVDPDTGMPVKGQETGPARPDVWPLDGEISPLVRPAAVLAAVRGLEIENKKIGGDRSIVTLDPLVVEIDRDPAALLVLLVAPLVTALLFGRAARRMAAGAGASATRAAAGLGLAGAVIGGAFTFGGAALLAQRGVPRLVPAWLEYLDRLRKAGLLERTDYFTRANVTSVATTALVFVVAAALAFVVVRRRG